MQKDDHPILRSDLHAVFFYSEKKSSFTRNSTLLVSVYQSSIKLYSSSLATWWSVQITCKITLLDCRPRTNSSSLEWPWHSLYATLIVIHQMLNNMMVEAQGMMITLFSSRSIRSAGHCGKLATRANTAIKSLLNRFLLQLLKRTTSKTHQVIRRGSFAHNSSGKEKTSFKAEWNQHSKILK